MSNFFEMGSSHIQPAWESNNNNKKVEEGMGLSTAARVRGVQARGGGTAAASGSLGWMAAGGGGQAPRPRLPLPVWPSTWRGPPGEGWGFLPQLFRNSLKGARRVRPGCAVHARTQWGSRHVLFNSRQKGERERRGAGQVKCWPRVPDTRLSWAKVQPRLRPPWDGKARSVFLRTERGGGGPTGRAWDPASSSRGAERPFQLPTSRRSGHRAEVAVITQGQPPLTPGTPTLILHPHRRKGGCYNPLARVEVN